MNPASTGALQSTPGVDKVKMGAVNENSTTKLQH